MEYKDQIKIALTIASLAAISILFTTQFRRLLKQKRLPSSCYLHNDRKPQFNFKRILADNSYSPFKHLKMNDSHTATENTSNSHPYEAEIKALLENPQVEFDFLRNDIDLKMSDSYVWVETESQLRELADTLSREKVFAVDTEQHSLRSFLGFTSLVQISTLNEDYLVNTIALHDVMGILRPVFADPSICKVFHGADNDILWLQRDFHIYVVNLYDTAKACDVLSKPQKSLAYLLETFCGVTTNKLLQREDWRQRPLPVEMVQYARTDTHYLLHILKSLITELKQKDSENSSCPDEKFHFLLEASRRSNVICLQLYSKEFEAFPGNAAASSIFSRSTNGQGSVSLISCETQFQDLVRRLCAWRDLMARVHDESLRYVLSDQAIVALAAQGPTTPTVIQSTIVQADMHADSSNTSSLHPSPSAVVCSHLDDVCRLIQNELGNFDDIFSEILQKCLGPNGICPLSVSNYGLLVNCNVKLTHRLDSKQNGVKNFKQVGRKASRELFVKRFSCKSPVYHNCRIYANDGRLLCYCDRRKLEWYLRRDLAKLIEENPPAIMLLFEPKGRPEDEGNDFYIQSKKNICVGCGKGDHYIRYRIIPSCYRVHFPEHLKSHRSHDIVLLCVDCHEVAHSAAEKHKRQIAAEFGVPLFVCKVVDSKEAQAISAESSESLKKLEEAGVSPLQLRTAAMALLRHGPRMPSNRREELTQIVMKYYGGRDISEEDLEKALLVGMSPHERKRLEKKKGLSLKHSASIIVPGEEGEYNSSSKARYNIPCPSEGDFPGGADANEAETYDTDPFAVTGTAKSTSSTFIDQGYNGGVSTIINDSSNPDSLEASDTKDVFGDDADDNSESRSPPNGEAALINPRYDGPAKHNSKLSLLGHGPHGKQVVDFLLKEYGENGISQFCQRWRQVFVEAVHPRFLPAGWDVMHSGKRDFGEFSVYNPAKKATTVQS